MDPSKKVLNISMIDKRIGHCILLVQYLFSLFQQFAKNILKPFLYHRLDQRGPYTTPLELFHSDRIATAGHQDNWDIFFYPQKLHGQLSPPQVRHYFIDDDGIKSLRNSRKECKSYRWSIAYN